MTASRFILALDRSEDNAQVLRVGADMARSLRAEIALVAVVDPRCAVAPDGGLPVDDLLTGLRVDAQQLLDRAGQQLPATIKAWKVLREGEPIAQIGQCALEWKAGYVVMGMHTLADTPGAVEAVARAARCPVILVPTAPEPERPADAPPDAAPAPPAPPAGLTERQATNLLKSHGPNEVESPGRNSAASFLMRFWGPVPWTLEGALLVILFLGAWRQAAIIAALLLFNAVIGAFYEARASAVLGSLRKRITIPARVRRDGSWTTRPARELVPGDLVHLRSGDVVPADVWLSEGTLLLDYSTLTGEALPVEVGEAAAAHAGTVVRRGEATGQVTATGLRTVFGTTALMIREAQAPGRVHTLMLRLVRLLAVIALAAGLLVVVAAPLTGMEANKAVSFGIALLIVAMPLSLPTMVTLTGAVGARELAARGILLTRLSAIQDAGAMDILCVDKTGTLTSNNISVDRLVCAAGASEADVLLAASAASTPASLDPLDVATLRASASAGIDTSRGVQHDFVPFDPVRNLCEGTLALDGRTIRGAKGSPAAVAALVGDADPGRAELLAHVDRLGATGGRVLAVAIAEPPDAPLRLTGLILYADPPREDAAPMIAGLRQMGVRVVMVTGDGLATAASVAAAVGVGQRGRSAEAQTDSIAVQFDCDIHAAVQPADKLALIRGLQNIGHVVGMTGDGVNDALALRQADIGIAVAGAPDVARAAAGVVLTEPGLAEVVEAVRIGRTIQQRIITYILSMIARKAIIVGFLAAALLATAEPALRANQVLLLVLLNVFLTLSISTDRVSPSPGPDHWSTRSLALLSLGIAGIWIALLLAVYLLARRFLSLGDKDVPTLSFVLLVLAGQAVVFNVRTRGWFWSSRPSGLVMAMSAFGAAAAAVAAIGGIFMIELPVAIVLGVFPVAALCLLIVDAAKVLLLSRYLGSRA